MQQKDFDLPDFWFCSWGRPRGQKTSKKLCKRIFYHLILVGRWASPPPTSGKNAKVARSAPLPRTYRPRSWPIALAEAIPGLQLLRNLAKIAKNVFFEQNLQNFPKLSERIRTHPNASGCMRTSPNASKQVQASPKTSKNLRGMGKTSKHLRKMSKKFQTKSSMACFFQTIFFLPQMVLRSPHHPTDAFSNLSDVRLVGLLHEPHAWQPGAMEQAIRFSKIPLNSPQGGATAASPFVCKNVGGLPCI